VQHAAVGLYSRSVSARQDLIALVTSTFRASMTCPVGEATSL